MTRNLELVQGLILTRDRSVQVNAVQDWSLGQLCGSDPGHGAGCAGRAVSGIAGRHRATPVRGRAQPGGLGLKAFAVAEFLCSAPTSRRQNLAGSVDEAQAAVRRSSPSLPPSPPFPALFGESEAAPRLKGLTSEAHVSN